MDKSASSRDGRAQRFHRHRRGQLLVPHDCLSGLLLSVNPRQEPKAVREAQLYLSSLVSDLEELQRQYEEQQRGREGAKGEGSDSDDESGSDDDRSSNSDQEEGGGRMGRAAAAASAPVQSVSSLLAAELAEAVEDDRALRGKRGRDEDNDETGMKKQRTERSYKSRFFVPIEIACKGYVLVNVPSVNPSVTCVLCNAAGAAKREEGGEGKGGAGSAPSPSIQQPHTIVINPLVAHIVERVFRDLRENPRPVLRQCFRLTPAELTCCPTLPEMHTALRALLQLHFPPLPSGGATNSSRDNDEEDEEEEEEEWERLIKGMQFQESLADLVPSHRSHARRLRRSMYTIGLQLTVKNNSKVADMRRQIESELRAAVPQNRFIIADNTLLAKQEADYRKKKKKQHEGQDEEAHSSRAEPVVDGVVQVFVAHSTCVMGVQRDYGNRCGYNLHALGEMALQLSN